MSLSLVNKLHRIVMGPPIPQSPIPDWDTPLHPSKNTLSFMTCEPARRPLEPYKTLCEASWPLPDSTQELLLTHHNNVAEAEHAALRLRCAP